MSGFYASNSRIRVVDGTDEVFDTDNNMPHIVGTADVLGQVVDFADMTQTQNYAGYDACAGYEEVGVWEYQTNYVPANWYYTSEYVPSTWSYERTYSYFSGWTYQRVFTPGYTTYTRVYEPPYYQTERVFYYEWQCYGADYFVYTIDAREYAATDTLVSMPTDEDGNPIDIDFIIVRATGSRTLDGSDPRFSQSFVSTVPPKSFSLQGSALLEASGEPSGQSWLRRIMSVVVDNTTHTIKLKRQESVASITRATYDNPFGTSNRSTFSFNFKIFFGRFKS